MKRIDITGIIGWDFTSDDLRRMLGSGSEDVFINVYSRGGLTFEGIEMYNILCDYSGHITVRLGAVAASAATIFPCAADKVVARKTTAGMIHKGWTCVCGNADEMRESADILEGLDSLILEAYTRKTGKKKSELLSDMASDKWLFGGDALVEYGLADEVTDDISDLPEAENEKTEEEAQQIVIEIQTQLREKEISAEQREKIAAMIQPKRGLFNKVRAQSKPKAKTDPVGADESTTREESMELSEIEKNPEAKAAFDALAAQKAEAIVLEKENEIRADAVAKDRENQKKLLTAMGKQLTDEQSEAFAAGKDAGAYALDVLAKQQGKKPAPNDKTITGISAASDPQDLAEVDDELKKSDIEKSNAAWDAIYGIKKEEK